MPERVGRKATAEYAEVSGKSRAQTQVVVLLSFIQSDTAFQLHARWRQRSLEEQRLSERPVRDQTQRAVRFAFGEGDELIDDAARRLQF